MKTTLPALCLLLMPLAVGGAAHADRDIVYAARYYLPPGSHGKSHFHLYRINPDGTGRTQITFGNADDSDPRWSPDGRRILFIREWQANDALYVMQADGSRLVRLWRGSVRGWVGDCHWSPDGRTAALSIGNSVLLLSMGAQRNRRLPNASGAYWSPDGQACYVVSAQGQDRILNLATGSYAAVTVPTYGLTYGGQKVVWRGKDTLTGIASQPEQRQVSLTTFDTDGKVVRTTPCRWPHSKTDPFADGVDPGARSLQPLPCAGPSVGYVQDVGNSSNRPDNSYWRANTATGEMRPVTEGEFLAWSPDGRRYCTAPARELAAYGESKYLYVSRLGVGHAAGPEQTRRTIVYGLVWVTGADWRHGGHVAAKR